MHILPCSLTSIESLPPPFSLDQYFSGPWLRHWRFPYPQYFWIASLNLVHEFIPNHLSSRTQVCSPLAELIHKPPSLLQLSMSPFRIATVRSESQFA